MRRYPHALTRAATVTAVAAIVAAGLPAVGATAAIPKPKPSCLLIVDPVGDARTGDTDIRSGDVASGTATIGGVLRLRSLVPEAASLTAARWDLSFTVREVVYTFGLRRDAGGVVTPTFARRTPGGTAGTVAGVTVTYDVARSEISWRVPRTAVPELPATPAGEPLYDLTAVTYVTPLDIGSDVALGGSYPDGNPSCLRVA